MFIEHINISAPLTLLITVKDFYCTLFALQPGFRPNFFRRGFWLYANGNTNAIIHLTASNEHHPAKSQGFLDHIAFQTSGLKNIIARLNAMNIPYQTEQLTDIGMTQLFLQDPAGITIEINFIDEQLIEGI